MSNSNRKGSLLELKAKKALEADGWYVHRTIRSSFKGQANDILGCIDLIAKKRGTRTRWIQVTTKNVGIGGKVADINEVPWEPEHDCVEVWQWMGIKPTGTSRLKWRESQHFRVRRMDDDWSIKDAIIVRDLNGS